MCVCVCWGLSLSLSETEHIEDSFELFLALSLSETVHSEDLFELSLSLSLSLSLCVCVFVVCVPPLARLLARPCLYVRVFVRPGARVVFSGRACGVRACVCRSASEG